MSLVSLLTNIYLAGVCCNLLQYSLLLRLLLYHPSSFETMYHTDLCSSAPQSPIQQWNSEKHGTVVEGNLNTTGVD